MRLRVFGLVCLIASVLIVASAIGQGADPLSGTWVGTWGPSPSDRNDVVVVLKWDGKALTGDVNPGPSATKLQKSTFDAKTGAVHMEAEAAGRGGAKIHYIIEGKVDKGTMSGTWNHDNNKGDFKIAKK